MEIILIILIVAALLSGQKGGMDAPRPHEWDR